MSIKKGEYFRNKHYETFGKLLTDEIDTWNEAVSMGAAEDEPSEFIEFIKNELLEMPKHIKNKMVMKIKNNAWDNESIMKYLYNYILCSKGMRENNKIKLYTS